MRKLTIALAGKRNSEAIVQPLLEIAEYATNAGHRVVLEAETSKVDGLSEYPARTADEIGKEADMVVVVGGDGTMLGIARQLAPYDVPLIGINQGRLGFMTDIPMADKLKVLPAMFAGEYVTEERSLLQARIIRPKPEKGPGAAGEEIFSALAFNDVVVARGAISGMVELSVAVDGHFMYSERADGLIVATPTGSTAYALSAHGPILHPSLDGFVLVPIAPHSLSNRPIALPDHCKIEIIVTAGREVTANFDMQSFTLLHLGDRVTVERAPMKVRFLHPVGYSYFATLRQKLHWHEHSYALAGGHDVPS
jgi:NAD+ kinase